jgi:hypothetical protein
VVARFAKIKVEPAYRKVATALTARITPHEYLPEIPDLLVLLTTNTISRKNVKNVFEQFFGPGQISDENSERIADFLTQKREHWLFMTQQKQ